jgi:hypothetical protein
MSVPISDLTTVRLTCKRNQCGGVSELPVTRLADPIFFKCPLCQQDLRRSSQSSVTNDPLTILSTVVAALKGMENNLAIEFLIPDMPP